MFAGITALAVAADVHMAEDAANLIGLPPGEEQRTAISQVGLATFGDGVAVLPAPGVHGGDPDPRRQHRLQRLPGALLAARARQLPAAPARQPRRPARVLERDRRCSRWSRRLLIVAFDADVTRLIQLYILGVFLSFTLSQAGMVRHWSRAPANGRAPTEANAACAASRRSTALGAHRHGAGLRDRAGHEVRRGRVDRRPRGADPVRRDEGGRRATTAGIADAARAGGRRASSLPARVHTVVLVSNLLAPTLRALAFAQATQSRDPAGRQGRRRGRRRPAAARVGASAASRCRWW